MSKEERPSKNKGKGKRHIQVSGFLKEAWTLRKDVSEKHCRTVWSHQCPILYSQLHIQMLPGTVHMISWWPVMWSLGESPCLLFSECQSLLPSVPLLPSENSKSPHFTVPFLSCCICHLSLHTFSQRTSAPTPHTIPSLILRLLLTVKSPPTAFQAATDQRWHGVQSRCAGNAL